MARCPEAPACRNDAREAASTQRGRADDGRGVSKEAPQAPDDRSSGVDRKIAGVDEVALPSALAQTVCEVPAGLNDSLGGLNHGLTHNSLKGTEPDPPKRY